MNLRDDSRKEWNGKGTLEHINAGSLQRIADGVEKMAASYDKMRVDRDWWKGRADYFQHESKMLERSNRSLRGTITKLKKRLAGV